MFDQENGLSRSGSPGPAAYKRARSAVARIAVLAVFVATSWPLAVQGGVGGDCGDAPALGADTDYPKPFTLLEDEANDWTPVISGFPPLCTADVSLEWLGPVGGIDDGFEGGVCPDGPAFDANGAPIWPWPATNLELTVTLDPNAPLGPRYINILIDLNSDGDWNDTSAGASGSDEWVIRDYQVDYVLPSDSKVPVSLPTPAGLVSDVNDGLPRWMRVIVTRDPIEPSVPSDWDGGTCNDWQGAGPVQYGEVEDYLMMTTALRHAQTTAKNLKHIGQAKEVTERIRKAVNDMDVDLDLLTLSAEVQASSASAAAALASADAAVASLAAAEAHAAAVAAARVQAETYAQSVAVVSASCPCASVTAVTMSSAQAAVDAIVAVQVAVDTAVIAVSQASASATALALTISQADAQVQAEAAAFALALAEARTLIDATIEAEADYHVYAQNASAAYAGARASSCSGLMYEAGVAADSSQIALHGTLNLSLDIQRRVVESAEAYALTMMHYHAAVQASEMAVSLAAAAAREAASADTAVIIAAQGAAAAQASVMSLANTFAAVTATCGGDCCPEGSDYEEGL